MDNRYWYFSYFNFISNYTYYVKNALQVPNNRHIHIYKHTMYTVVPICHKIQLLNKNWVN